MIRVSTQYKYNLLGGYGGGFAGMFADAVIRVYSGAMPDSADNAPAGTYLGYITRDGLLVAAGHGLHFDLSLSAYVTQTLGEVWKLTGIAPGTAGWCRLSAVNDPAVLSPTTPRVDFQVNPADGVGFLISDPGISTGLVRDVPFFNYSIPG